MSKEDKRFAPSVPPAPQRGYRDMKYDYYLGVWTHVNKRTGIRWTIGTVN